MSVYMTRFRASDFHVLYQPSECTRRVWLMAHRPHLAADDTEFQNLLRNRGALLERRHLDTLGAFTQPEYPVGDMSAGLMATRELIAKRAPVIYQPVLVSKAGLLGIPDFLVLDEQRDRYKIRDVKMATDLERHVEIALQIGLYRMAASEVLGYEPETEIVTGDGILRSFDAAKEHEVISAIERIESLRSGEEPWEPVGFSKCDACVFRGTCWEQAMEGGHTGTVPYVDQGTCRSLREMGVHRREQLYEMSEELIGNIERPRGKAKQKVGAATARKIRYQLKALLTNQPVIVSPVVFPGGNAPGKRPVMMFDIENDVFDPELGVKVYLWGLLLSREGEVAKPKLVVAGPGVEGDRDGWLEFLKYSKEVFDTFGDIPFVHYSSHERTWVNKYMERYGDVGGTAERILKNLWDMREAIRDRLYLPVPAYGLKFIERTAGFKRTQQEYGGLWSIIKYDKYVNARLPEEASAILDEILAYNTEDLIASLKVYEWLESLSG